MCRFRAFGEIIEVERIGLLIGLDEDFPSRGRRKSVSQISIHESATHDGDVLEDEPGERDDATERGLRRRGLGVHFAIGVGDDGEAQVVQHNDLQDELYHTGGPVNDLSVGIEIINPYYAVKGPWQRIIDAPWAHKGRYVLPTEGQCEALWGLVDAITTASDDGAHGLDVPRYFWGLDGNGRFRMGPMPKRFPRSTSGVLAHHQYGHHADGCFPALYCVLREAGMEIGDAYERAVTLATGARALVKL